MSEPTLNGVRDWISHARDVIEMSSISNLPMYERSAFYLVLMRTFPADGQLRYGVLSYLVALEVIRDWNALRLDFEVSKVPRQDLQSARQLLSGKITCDDFDRDVLNSRKWRWAEESAALKFNCYDGVLRGLIAPSTVASISGEFCCRNARNSQYEIDIRLNEADPMDLDSLDVHAKGAFNVSGYPGTGFKDERKRFWLTWLDSFVPQILTEEFRKILETPISVFEEIKEERSSC